MVDQHKFHAFAHFFGNGQALLKLGNGYALFLEEIAVSGSG